MQIESEMDEQKSIITKEMCSIEENVAIALVIGGVRASASGEMIVSFKQKCFPVTSVDANVAVLSSSSLFAPVRSDFPFTS